MSDIKLFNIQKNAITELKSQSFDIERSLQALFEKHLEPLLGIRFLATEYSTGRAHGGRIDTLGIDEDGCPTIIEYKRQSHENVINQGLFYLDWLMDHRAEFELMVMKELGNDVANDIDWSSPRLLCIANDFSKYDSHAVQQINRNIELLRYKRYGEELLLLELVNATSSAPTQILSTSKNNFRKTITEKLVGCPDEMQEVFDVLKDYMLSLGDDVQFKTLKHYFAFKTIRNFASVQPHKKHLRVFLSINPDEIQLEPSFMRDIRNIGHHGTGSLELCVSNFSDVERAKPWIKISYENN